MANKDSLLGITADIDFGADSVDGIFFFVFNNCHGTVVRDFFVVVKEEFFADKFSDEETQGSVGELFFIEIRGMMGANTFKGIEEFIES